MAIKAVFFAAVFLAYATSLEAHIVATSGRSPAGVAEVRVRNNGAISVAAFAIAMNPSQETEDLTQFVMFFDPIIDKTGPFEAGQERTVPVLLRLRAGDSN